MNESQVSGSTQRDRRPLLLLLHQSGSDVSGMRDYLAQGAFRVLRAKLDPGAVAVARRSDPDVIVLKVDATDNGLQLMRQIHTEVAVPVIVVAPGDHADPVEALDHGADDYLIEPAAFPEVAARARAAVRRSMRLPSRRVRQLGALELDGQARQARTGNRRLPLTPVDYTILEFLARTPGQVVRHDDLVQAAGEGKPNSIATLGQRVRRIRCKLSAAGVTEPIITVVRGVGYRLDTR